MLDPIQSHALCLCLGAFRTSPLSSLHVEANDILLDLRRRKLAAQYCLKVSAETSNLAVKCCKLYFQQTLLLFFIDILVKYVLWASVSAPICMPFILHRRIYFQLLLLHTLHGFTLHLFLICLLVGMQNLIPALKFSKVTLL